MSVLRLLFGVLAMGGGSIGMTIVFVISEGDIIKSLLWLVLCVSIMAAGAVSTYRYLQGD